MRSNTLILGKGHIGQRLYESLQCDISAKKIYSFEDVETLIHRYTPKVIINCIGHAGASNVDDCEKLPDKTLLTNTFIPILLAETALRKNIKLVQISSGCIYHYDYSKDKPIPESKVPDFYDLFYSRAKIYSDTVLKDLSKFQNILIARIRVPLDNKPHPKNILTKLIKYKKVIDVPNSVTYIPDLVEALKHLIRIDAKGVYNIVNRGALHYPDLLDVYKKYSPEFDYEVINYKKLNLVRTNLILSPNKLSKSGFKVRAVKDILDECVKNYLKS